MRIDPTPLPGLLVIEPQRFGDERGVFCETFKAARLAEFGFDRPFIQDNLARSPAKGTVRGLHFQTGAHAQDKLIRCARGAIFDAVVDIRPGSPTFGRSFAAELSAENWLQLLVPAGFAHGYCTLTPDAEVHYKVSAPYAPQAEGGLLWSDPALDIAWPVTPDAAVVNARDQAWPTLAALLAQGGAGG
jgi:dTDP-4-dehydrorhamnose 3,5-epimerase